MDKIKAGFIAAVLFLVLAGAAIAAAVEGAGAGVPDHLHAHLIPRWTGDTNFIPVLSDVRVVPVMLDELYQQMVEAALTLDLPSLAGADQ